MLVQDLFDIEGNYFNNQCTYNMVKPGAIEKPDPITDKYVIYWSVYLLIAADSTIYA